MMPPQTLWSPQGRMGKKKLEIGNVVRPPRGGATVVARIGYEGGSY